jgi:uncharacterized protein (DUF2252 family)
MATKTTTRPLIHESIEERAARGRTARARVPRSSHAVWSAADRKEQPLDLLAEQAAQRVPDLVPIRYGRMAATPFTYYRGAALPMAADLSITTHTGLMVQLCGDAHLSNFGGFATPERDLVFDVNDFDETLPGPFEWDIKRLAASLEVAGRSKNLDEKARQRAVRASAAAYRQAMAEFAGQHNLDIWYSHLDLQGMVARWGADVAPNWIDALQRRVAKAETKDRLKARAKLTVEVDGELRFISEPPLIVPVEELFPEEAARNAVEETVRPALRSYRRSLNGDRRHLLEQYRFTALARKVVGVGSVGTRAWVALFVGRDNADTQILQLKEAQPSVLERYVAPSAFDNAGQRVVEGQRFMQASSDIFLGWTRASSIDGTPVDYYVRQLWDWKVSAEIDTMPPEIFPVYGQICAWTLARGHARSGDPVAIAAYLGTGDTFDRAIGEFASVYADQNERDHDTLVEAIAAGKIEARMGV